MQYQCNDCPRKCGIIRNEDGFSSGFCKMPLNPRIARADLHFWEEPCISGNNGSGTIFFSGCNLRCVYCQNFEISHKNSGKTVSVQRLAELMQQLEQRGAHNINFVNPTHYIKAITEALKIYRPKIPLVYNSGGYDLAENIERDIFDIYLIDIKYISPEKSLRYSGIIDYFDYASKAVLAAYKLKSEPKFSSSGIMQSGLIVRHLVLPMNTNESIKIIDWVNDNIPNAYLSVMAQYYPCGDAERFAEINRIITQREYDKVIDHVLSKNMENVYIQSRKSAADEFIPEFNSDF